MTRRSPTAWIVSAAFAALFFLCPHGQGALAAEKTCYDCHEEAQARFKKKFQHQPVAKEDCESCHARHGFANVLMLKKEGKELCLTCHTDFDSLVARGNIVHPAVSEQLCATCHDPHASNRAGLMREVEGDLACFVCHTALADTTGHPTPHAPFAERQCGECHVDHSGNHAGLLVGNESDICARCHEPGKAQQSHAAKSLTTAGLACSGCHDPHRSTQPALVSAHVHQPVASGMCDACHTGEVVPPAQMPAADSTWSGCSPCHDDIAAKLALANPHAPAAMGECFQCHSGHSSRRDALLKAGAAELCQTCHEDMAATALAKQTSVHRPIIEGNCSACHDPHGSAGKALLLKEGDALCTSCHSTDKFTHSQHLEKSGSSCMDCHVPHSSNEPFLLSAEPRSTCSSCHQAEVTLAFTAHEPYAKGDCAICHDPHSGPGKNLQAEVPHLCFNCHQNIGRFIGSGVQHSVAEDCLACHAAHEASHGKLLAKDVRATCSECHEVAVLAASTSVHDPFAKADCAGCHNPHGSQLNHLVGPRRQMQSTPMGAILTYPKVDSTSVSLCRTCHNDELETWQARPVQHLPARNGECATCHVTHQSEFSHLLSKPTSQLCQGCHDTSTIPPEPHRGINLASADCGQCHDPHASEKKGLLKANSHPPFADGSCDVCHSSPGSVALTEAQPTLCLNCHEEMSAQMALKTPHAPVTAGTCTVCHSPHTSNENSLLLTNAAALCRDCHDAAPGKVVHAPYEAGECEKCHAAHGSDTPALLTKPANALCLDCHGVLAERLNSGRRHAAIDQGCLACHTGHATDNASLLKSPPRQLCAGCHNLTSDRWRAAHTVAGSSGDGGDCMSCHDPHVAPVGTVALLKRVQHAPFEARECTSCHKSGQSALHGDRNLCGECHQSTLATIDKSAFKHAAMADSAACLACHSPHVGETSALLRSTGFSVCLDCHKTVNMSQAYLHAPAKEDCANCHTPHGGTNKPLLSEADIMTLCSGCHEEAAKTHFHPMGDRVRDEKNKGTIVCTSCHSPHNSEEKALLLGDPIRGLCVRCHDPSGHQGG